MNPNGYQIWPQVFEWTSYGLCSLQRNIWTMFRNDLDQLVPVKPYWVELVAALERTLNYMHTGNAKVLTRGLMDPLWMSLSLVNDGLPCISEVVSLSVLLKYQVDIRHTQWPTYNNEPHIASKMSHVFNYGLDHFEVCKPAHPLGAHLRYDCLPLPHNRIIRRYS